MRIIVEVDKYVANVLNKILTTTLTIVTIHIGLQIAEVIISSMQDLVRVGNWKRKCWELNTGITSHTSQISETPTTKADLVADKVKTPAQTNTSMGKTNQEKSMELSPATQPIKCVTEKSPSKTIPKDRRSPIRPPTCTDTSPNKKLQKDKTKITSKQKTVDSENVDSSNKFKILEKM